MTHHYDITIGNNVARDVHSEIIIGHGIVMGTYDDVIMHTDVATTSFIMHYYAQLWYFCFLDKIYKIVLYKIISSKQN